ncbi:MAG: helix-turn-helix domain-containing protein [Holosporales bacterium]|nr:helix-turn-helix domain-containing protein [Holosporales bacterium]
MRYFKESSNLLSIGKKLKTKRQELKLTQKDLASSVGVTSQQLQKYESGQSKISIEMLLNLCRELKVNFDYFLPKIQITNLKENEKINETIKNYNEEALEQKLIEKFRAIENPDIKISILKITEVLLEINKSK